MQDEQSFNLTQNASRLVAEVCQQLDSDLRAGRDARIHEYLDDIPGVTRELQLQKLLITYLQCKREQDPLYDHAHLYNQFPDHHSLIQEAEKRVTPLRPTGGDALGRPAGMPLQLGNYRLGKLLGRGANSVVFLGTDVHTQEEYAIKIPQVPALFDPRARERFLKEASAEARLNHPNIAKLHEVGAEDPVCYLVCEYVNGPTLMEWLRSQSDVPVPIEDAVRFLIALCDPVSYAHERGVSHLDITPNNLLLKRHVDPQREDYRPSRLNDFQVKVTAFGLSHIVGKASQYSISDLADTLSYIAPELTSGTQHTVDHRADIYALGAILYLLFTNRAPFQSTNMQELLFLAHRGYPEIPDRWRDDLPETLVSICLKCLEKEPSRRYQSVNQLSLDLQRYLAGRQPTTCSLRIQCLRWWYCQNPTRGNVIVSAAAMLCLIVTLTIYSIFLILDANKSLQMANETLAEKIRNDLERDRKLRQQAYAAAINTASTLLDLGELKEAHRRLSEFVPKSGEVDLRGCEWYLLNRRSIPLPHRQLTRFPDAITAVTYSPRGDLIAVGGISKIVRLIDPKDGTELYPALPHSAALETLAFAPDGKTLATGTADGFIRLWQPGSDRPIREWQGHPTRVQCLDWSPDGSQLLSGGRDATIRRWDVKTGIGHVFSELGMSVRTVRWSPSGKRVYAASDRRDSNAQNESCILDPVTGELHKNLISSQTIVLASRFIGEDRLILAGRSGVLEYWDKQMGAGWQRSKITSFDSTRINDMAVSASGSLVLVCQEGSATLCQEGDIENTILSPATGARIWTGAISPLEDEVVTAGDDGCLDAWPLKSTVSWPRRYEIPGVIMTITILEGEPQSQILAVGNEAAMHLKLDREARDKTKSIKTGDRSYFGMFDERGTPQLFMFGGGIVPFEETEIQKRLQSPGERTMEHLLDLQPDKLEASSRTRYLMTTRNNTLEVVDVHLRKRHTYKFDSHISRASFVDDDKIIVSCVDRIIHLIRAADGSVIRHINTPLQQLYHYCTAGSDGSIAAAAEGNILVWGPGDTEPRYRLVGHKGQVTAILFSPDCKTLVSYARDQTIRFWRMDTGYEVLRLPTKQALHASLLRFYDDGLYLVFGFTRSNKPQMSEIQVFDLRPE